MSIENKVPMSDFTEVTDIEDTARIIGLQDNENVKIPLQSLIAKTLSRVDEDILTVNDINVDGGVTGFEPIGEVKEGDKRAVSGSEVSKSVSNEIESEDLRLNNFNHNLLSKKQSLSTNKNDFIANGSAVITNENKGILVSLSGARYDGFRVINIANDLEFIKISFFIKANNGSPLLGVFFNSGVASHNFNSNNKDWELKTFVLKNGRGYDDGRISIVGDEFSSIGEFYIKDLLIVECDEFGNELTSLSNLKISIGGDSISTINGNNAVEIAIQESDIGKAIKAYPTFYDLNKIIGGKNISSSMIGILTEFTPTQSDIGKTIGQPLNYNTLAKGEVWSEILCNRIGAKLHSNVSWSGSRVSRRADNTEDIYKTSHLWHPAQIEKLANRDSNGIRIAPDVIILARGVNDFSHVNYARLSDYNPNDGYPLNDEITDDGLPNTFCFKKAIALTIKECRNKYPFAKIILCTMVNFKRINYNKFPVNNGINTILEFNNAIRELANDFGCGLIEFDKCWSYENMYPTFINDSQLTPTHPNKLGHEVMAKRAINDIKKFI